VCTPCTLANLCEIRSIELLSECHTQGSLKGFIVLVLQSETKSEDLVLALQGFIYYLLESYAARES
jgi:hypothetical protein